MGFHVTSKKVLLPVEPWGMRMWSAYTALNEWKMYKIMQILVKFVFCVKWKMQCPLHNKASSVIYFFQNMFLNFVYNNFVKLQNDYIRQLVEWIFAKNITKCLFLPSWFRVKNASSPEQVILLYIEVFRIFIFNVMVWKYLFASIQHTEVWFSH